jgi:tetratricopeptide (TPR) repeat protein
MAKCHHQLESYKVANQYVDLFLRNDPDNVVGLKLKGRILYSMQEYDSSAIYFEKVIQLSIRTLPENYLETAQSWTASALPDKYQKATNILELGLKNLGAVITLQNALIELHIQNQNKEKAFELQLKILENTKRKESAYVKLAELYIQFEEMEKAKSALIDAKAEWEKLPLRIRNNASMSSLIEKIEQLLTNLN